MRPVPFDAHLVDFLCSNCNARIREPIASFRREYHCYGCNREIRITELDALEQWVERFGDAPYAIICRRNYDPWDASQSRYMNQIRPFTVQFAVVTPEIAELWDVENNRWRGVAKTFCPICRRPIFLHDEYFAKKGFKCPECKQKLAIAGGVQALGDLLDKQELDCF